MFGMLKRLYALFTDLSLPAGDAVPIATVTVPATKPLPEYDGRFFAWVKLKDFAGFNPLMPVIIRDKNVGSKMEIVEHYIINQHEYDLSINDWIAMYPAPVSKEDDK